MSKHDDEQYLDFLRYQEVEVKHVATKSERTVTKADERFMRSRSAKREVKAQAKQDRKRNR